MLWPEISALTRYVTLLSTLVALVLLTWRVRDIYAEAGRINAEVVVVASYWLFLAGIVTEMVWWFLRWDLAARKLFALSRWYRDNSGVLIVPTALESVAIAGVAASLLWPHLGRRGVVIAGSTLVTVWASGFWLYR